MKEAPPQSQDAALQLTAQQIVEIAEKHTCEDWVDGYLGSIESVCRMALALASPAPVPASPVSAAAPEAVVRYCPGCGSVGTVEAKYRDCCPDGSEARMIPQALAEKCRDTFKLAVRNLTHPPAASEPFATSETQRHLSTHSALGARRRMEMGDLISALTGAANYIDTLGGNSQTYRITLAAALASEQEAQPAPKPRLPATQRYKNWKPAELAAQPAAQEPSKDAIREVFIHHGFTIKDGQTDLKDYVYDAAYALLALASHPPSAQEPSTERAEPQGLTDADLSDLMELHRRSTPGKWQQGQTSHHTVSKREGKEPYRIAEFRHADDASFCDAAHEWMPKLIAAVLAARATAGSKP